MDSWQSMLSLNRVFMHVNVLVYKIQVCFYLNSFLTIKQWTNRTKKQTIILNEANFYPALFKTMTFNTNIFKNLEQTHNLEETESHNLNLKLFFSLKNYNIILQSTHNNPHENVANTIISTNLLKQQKKLLCSRRLILIKLISCGK